MAQQTPENLIGASDVESVIKKDIFSDVEFKMVDFYEDLTCDFS